MCLDAAVVGPREAGENPARSRRRYLESPPVTSHWRKLGRRSEVAGKSEDLFEDTSVTRPALSSHGARARSRSGRMQARFITPRLRRCLLALVWLANLPAAAQSEPARSQETTETSEPVIDVTVRGARLRAPVSPRDPTAASTVVSKESLQSPGASSADVIARVPGVQVSRTGASSDLATASIRGASSAQTPVYLAGILLNDDVAGTADLSTVPLWMLDRVGGLPRSLRRASQTVSASAERSFSSPVCPNEVALAAAKALAALVLCPPGSPLSFALPKLQASSPFGAPAPRTTTPSPTMGERASRPPMTPKSIEATRTSPPTMPGR